MVSHASCLHMSGRLETLCHTLPPPTRGVHEHTHTHTHARTHARTHTHTHTAYPHTYVSTHARTHARAHTHAHKHTHTYIMHARTHTHTHTRTHTYTHTRARAQPGGAIANLRQQKGTKKKPTQELQVLSSCPWRDGLIPQSQY